MSRKLRFSSQVITVLAVLLMVLPTALTGWPARAEGEGKTKRFDTLDANHDGALSKEEFRSGGGADPQQAKKRDARFDRLDTDGDGQLSPAEFAAASAKGAPGGKGGKSGKGGEGGKGGKAGKGGEGGNQDVADDDEE